VVASIVRLLRLASVAICLIVIASFGLFAINETKSASGRQQAQLLSETPAATTGTHASSGAGTSAPKHESAVHKAIDEASSKLTSPFSGVLSSSSEWARRSGNLLLALLIYGFGLGYLARMLRVRV
jgi:predicted PurR-regulated permease PerM